MTTAVAKTNNNPNRVTDPRDSLAKLLTENAAAVKKLAPKYVNTQRLLSLAIEAVGRSELLAKCSQMSVLLFCKKCAEWGTDRIGPGGVWPVPFWNSKGDGGKGCYEMQAVPDWRLLIEKTKKAKAIFDATADVVREKDHFVYTRGMNPTLEHAPARGPRGEITEVYCVYVLPDGLTKNFVVMDWKEEVIPIRNRSKAWEAYQAKKIFTCPWVTDEAEMGKKTVVKRAMKLFEGASIELTSMLEADNTILGNTEINVTERNPVPSPTEIGAGDPPTADPEPEPTKSQAKTDGAPEGAKRDAAPAPGGNSAGNPEPIPVPEGCQVDEGILQDIEPRTMRYQKDTDSHKKGDTFTAWNLILEGAGGIAKYGCFDEKVANSSVAFIKKSVKIIYKVNGAYRNFVSIHPL